MVYILGMVGLAQAGKTTAASVLCQHYWEKSKKEAMVMSMAGPLKEGLEVMGITKHKVPDLYRMAAQYLGTNIVRQYDPNWWCKLFSAEVAFLDGLYHVVAVDDVRFPNEAQTIRENNGILLYIHPGHRLDLEQPLYKHESEHLAMGIHQYVSTLDVDWTTVNYISVATKEWGKVYIVNNTRSLEDFHKALKVLHENIQFNTNNSISIDSVEIEGGDEGLAC